MGREDYLFAEGDLDATLRAHQGSISAKMDAIPRDQFMNAQPEEIIDHILSEMTVEPLVIYEDRAEMDQRETKIDVSGWRDRNPFGDRGPIHVSGVAVSVSLPFTGDSSLWKLKPNQLKGPGSNISARVHTCLVARASILMAYRCTSCNAATTASPASLAKKTIRPTSTGWAKL